MKTVTCNQLVWLREVAHERGTRFSIVTEPKLAREIDQTTADAWRREGWLEASRKAPAATGEGA